MSVYERELEGMAVVLVGRFNPAIIHPTWLCARELVSTPQQDAAKIEMNSDDISMFRIGAMAFQVVPDRFQLATDSVDEAPSVIDLVAGIFEILRHTPMTQMGINRYMHFRMPDENVWHRVGHAIVPKEKWKGFMDDPGTASVTVQGARRGAASKYVRMTVEPSKRILPGVFIGVNEHFESSDANGVSTLMKRLREDSIESWNFARDSAAAMVAGWASEST